MCCVENKLFLIGIEFELNRRWEDCVKRDVKKT